ncbi:M23 family metallopeptidase [Tenacibaculum maritimum]|uniref:M23 family metallopeptidase n=1 Tax=Tenacibaculum maritimum TaxID=107401 RepID=UPI00388DF539
MKQQKKGAIWVCLFWISYSLIGQVQLKTYTEKIADGYEFLVDNDAYCPVSMVLNLELHNMTSTHGNHKIFVIPARSKKHLVTTLKIAKKGRYGYQSKVLYNYGNHLKNTYDQNYRYSLPFAKGQKINVCQGYEGSFSHQNEKALDFAMEIGTAVYAAREGVVVKVIDHNHQTCSERKCTKYNNIILIYHKDGTFSEYAHLQKNGALVKVGDPIKKNQLIAKSGNVGFSTGPHLHFAVFKQEMKGRETIKTKFNVYNSANPMYLEEGMSYKKASN